MKTAVDSPSIDRTSHAVFIPEDWKEFAAWCLQVDFTKFRPVVSDYKTKLNKPTNVSTFNHQFYEIKQDGLYSGNSEEWCLTILMLCAAIESGDTFISSPGTFDGLGFPAARNM